MSLLLAAIGRQDIADYVEALFLVYMVLIFLRVLLSWIPHIPYILWLRAIIRFIEETTDPYLNIFRRFIPPIGGRLDISPIVAIILLIVLQGIVVGAIRG